MGLLYEAYLAKLRAYQAVERLREEVDFENPPAPGLSFQLPPVPAPDAPAAAPAAEAPRRSKAYEVIDAVQAALDRLPEVFDRFDVLDALDFEPRRSTLLTVLQELRQQGVLQIVRDGGGKRTTLYRKAAASAPSQGS
jgi:hypothetical protein